MPWASEPRDTFETITTDLAPERPVRAVRAATVAPRSVPYIFKIFLTERTVCYARAYWAAAPGLIGTFVFPRAAHERRRPGGIGDQTGTPGT
jgi:hypothetical protein